LTQLRDCITIGGELGDDMMILVFDTTSGLHYYWSLSLCYVTFELGGFWAFGLLSLVVCSRCKASQAHEESCVSNGLRMYAAELVMDQGKTWLAQAGKLIDW
jgi:hypothetical protein